MGHLPLLWQYVSHKINELSGLSGYETICLVANYNLYANGPTIDPAIYNRGFTAEVLKVMEEAAERDFDPVTSLGIRFEKPLENFPCANLDFVLALYGQYEAGNLPYPGSVSEQPAQIIQIFNTLRALKNEQEELARKRAK